jgi:hypothetical protein
MKSDPGVDAVRAARAQISRDVGHDAARLVAHYMDLQTRFRGRVILGPETDDVAPRPSVTPGESGSSAAGSRR